MESFIIVALVILVILAITDLTVGVANDAVNFLNSAWGAKAGSVRMLMIIVSVGVLVGAMFSGGMMEIARKGIFNPQSFYLNEIIIIFVAVMITDVLLLDFFNTIGLPTSTTVSLVFELLGSAFMISTIKILQSDQSFDQISNYLNSDKALAIISGIFISVGVAFVVGIVVQYIARILFSFSYKRYRIIGGSIFGGLALAIISYFIFYKGMKTASFVSVDFMAWTEQNIILILAVITIAAAVFFAILQSFTKISVFRFIVLYGTFALAMSFAGNDLVNFIGVPLAGVDSHEIYATSGAADPTTFSMEKLAGEISVPPVYLIFAGVVMIITLWFNKKLRTVLKTSVDLSRQSEGKERFGSSPISRGIVRFIIRTGHVLSFFKAVKASNWVNSRFSNNSEETGKPDAPAFDMIRASVNLTVASSLIAFATSLKLPLSTTYVTFMVAMGTSLSDRAWGRESAVYRITGVLTVIGGWFLTAFIAFIVAAIIALTIFYTEWIGLIGVFSLAVFLFIRNHFKHKKIIDKEEKEESISKELDVDDKHLVSTSKGFVVQVISSVPTLFDNLYSGIQEENLKKIRKTHKKFKEIDENTDSLKHTLGTAISHLNDNLATVGEYYIENVELLRELSVSLMFIANPVYQHLNNHHANFNKKQLEDLKVLLDAVKAYINNTLNLLKSAYEKPESFAHAESEMKQMLHELKMKQVKQLKKKEVTQKSNLLLINIIGEIGHIVYQMGAFLDNEMNLKQQHIDL